MTKMRLLILWRDIPSPIHPSLARPFYFIKYGKNHEITLASFFSDRSSNENIDHLYSRVACVKLLKVKSDSKDISAKLRLFKNKITYQNIFFSKSFNIFRGYYPAMREEIISLLKSKSFDIIYADYLMHPYLYNLNVKIPIVLEFFSPTSYLLYQSYLHEKIFSQKIRLLFEYYSHRLFEAPRYKEFDAGICVTELHKRLSEPFLPKTVFIIPPGVDLDHFRPNASSTSRSLVFTGDMSYPINIHATLHFCDKIYPLVKKEIRDLKFYIVGRSPPDEIKRLSLRDNSIIVTGEVDDVRPYISRSQIVVAPITINDGGIKTKILEAMAMGKAIVSTKTGVDGIGPCPKDTITITPNARDFAESVVDLLQDHKRRRRIGRMARKFVEKEYSWQRMTGILEKTFEDTFHNSPKK